MDSYNLLISTKIRSRLREVLDIYISNDEKSICYQTFIVCIRNAAFSKRIFFLNRICSSLPSFITFIVMSCSFTTSNSSVIIYISTLLRTNNIIEVGVYHLRIQYLRMFYVYAFFFVILGVVFLAP